MTILFWLLVFSISPFQRIEHKSTLQFHQFSHVANSYSESERKTSELTVQIYVMQNLRPHYQIEFITDTWAGMDTLLAGPKTLQDHAHSDLVWDHALDHAYISRDHLSRDYVLAYASMPKLGCPIFKAVQNIYNVC